MKKSINQLQERFWYGKPKYHYQVFHGRKLQYTCISVAKYQHEIIDCIVERFKGDRRPFKLFCNDTHIKTINEGKIGRKSKYHFNKPK